MIFTEEEAKRIARGIAYGHAYWEHATNVAESGELMSESSFESIILHTLLNPDKYRILNFGRSAFWNNEERFVVIHSPNDPDLGTAYWPIRGIHELKRIS